MITPYLTMKDVPMVVVNHTYMEIGMFPKAVVSGGTGIYYSADTIWILGRQQDKDGTEIKGYHFIINVEKSRYVKEKSKIPVSVSFEGGIQRFSGLLDIALAGGFVVKPSNGWYQKVDRATGELIGGKVREAQTLNEEFWCEILTSKEFHDYVKETFQVGHASMFQDEDVEEANEDNE
jgi:hypothetical protein